MGKKKYKKTEYEKKKISSLGLRQAEVMPEEEFREKILNFARANGIYVEVNRILERYDRLLEKETDPKDREALGIMGISEIHKYIGFHGGLTVNLKPIIAPTETEDDQKIIVANNEI